jgi:hypothetical protein
MKFDKEKHTALIGRARAIQQEAANFRHTTLTMAEAIRLAEEQPTGEVWQVDIPVYRPVNKDTAQYSFPGSQGQTVRDKPWELTDDEKARRSREYPHNDSLGVVIFVLIGIIVTVAALCCLAPY